MTPGEFALAAQTARRPALRLSSETSLNSPTNLPHAFSRGRPEWEFEHRLAGDHASLFFLVVLASSDGPGLSPIFPFNQPDNSPMFAVHFWGSNCIVWQEQIFRGQFVECKNSEEIAGAFMRFLDEWNFTSFDSAT